MGTANETGRHDAPGAPADPRLPGESPESYAGYLAYRDRGIGRDLFEAFRLEHRGWRGSRRDQAFTAWMLRTERWRWAERARAWDIARGVELLRQLPAKVEALKAAIAAKAPETGTRGRLRR
jgi:hypothetical protein